MELTFLGTGTSTGVPQIGCNCEVCTSTDPRDKRLRASVLVTLDNGKRLLIDCGPDFRAQILSVQAPPIEALLITHSHYDHVGGIDDLRPYSAGRNFPVYCKPDVEADLRARNPWSFTEHPYPGVPTFEIHDVEPERPFEVAGTEIVPLPVMHYKLPIIGYRIGPLAYITDCKTMPSTTLRIITGCDTLVINALRKTEHISHQTLAEALDIIEKANPRVAYLTHLSHDMGLHSVVEKELPPRVHIAYDGQTIRIPTYKI